MSKESMLEAASMDGLLREVFPEGIGKMLEEYRAKSEQTGLNETEEKKYGVLCEIYQEAASLSVRMLKWIDISSKNRSR